MPSAQGFSGVPAAVLSQQFEEAIDGRKVVAGVFLTHDFDPAFFEQHVLSLLFQRAYSTKENLKLFQLEDELQHVNDLAVYYDRRQLKPNGGSARLAYERIGLGRQHGKFHAKNVFLLLQNEAEEGEDPPESLLLVTTSANLVQSGWWKNVEVAHFMEINEGDRFKARADLIGHGGLFDRLEKEDNGRASHRALARIRKFVIKQTEEFGFRKWKKELQPRLYSGRETFPDFIAKCIKPKPGKYRLEIISPFFQNTQDPKVLDALLDTIRPKEVRIHQPRDDDAGRNLLQDHYEAICERENVHWTKLPARLTSLKPSIKDAAQRFVHAKVYRLFSKSPAEEYVICGSVNLTQAAHAKGKQGNFETAVLVGGKVKRRPDWWLSRTELVQPQKFLDPEKREEQEPDLAYLPVSLRFDWREDQLYYFWEEGEAPDSFAISSSGTRIGEVSDIASKKWTPTDAALSEAARERLQHSSFMTVKTVDAESLVLVSEEHMPHKPSLAETLSPEDILEFWSTLSPERRDAILESKLAPLLEDALAQAGQTAGPRPRDTESMFDRFAGIFHAFSCLEERVDEALEAGREHQAEALLFGQRLDSLKVFVRQEDEREDVDPVNRYASLLCAQGLVEHPKEGWQDFFGDLSDQVEELRVLIAHGVASSKQTIQVDDPEFLDWFEKAFFANVSVPGQEGASG